MLQRILQKFKGKNVNAFNCQLSTVNQLYFMPEKARGPQKLKELKQDREISSLTLETNASN